MTRLSDKEEYLEYLVKEYSNLLKYISICYYTGADVTRLLQKKKKLKQEIEKLQKEVGYKIRSDFDKEI